MWIRRNRTTSRSPLWPPPAGTPNVLRGISRTTQAAQPPVPCRASPRVHAARGQHNCYCNAGNTAPHHCCCSCAWALITPRSPCSSRPVPADARTAAAAVVLAALMSPRSPCSSRPAPADACAGSAVVVLVALIPPRAAAIAVRPSRTAAAAAHRPLLATAPPLPQLGCHR